MLQRSWELIRRFMAATRIGWAGMAWLAAAMVVVAGSFLVISAAAEDVIRRNGLELRDSARLHWFIAERSETTVAIAKFVTVLGSPILLLTVAVVVGAWLWHRGSHLVVAATPALALGAAGVAATLAKAAVGRQRPPVSLHLVNETEPSFPSGHATDSTALYVCLALIIAITILRSPRARAGVVAAGMALAGAIGVSRLLLGVHWPSDVIAGWALGLMVATLVAVAAVLVARTQPSHPVASEGRLRRLLARMHDLALVERTRPLAFGT